MAIKKNILQQAAENIKLVLLIGGMIVGAITFTIQIAIQVNEAKDIIKHYDGHVRKLDSLCRVVSDMNNVKFSPFEFREDFDNYKFDTQNKLRDLYHKHHQN